MIKHKFRRQLLSNNLLDKSLSKGLVAVIGALLVSCSANAPKGNGFGAGATTKQKLDEVANNLRNARAELGQIDAQMNAQQASINSAATRIEETRAGAVQEEVQLDFYTVAAPFAGIVGDIPIKVGDNVNSTTQLTTVTQNQVLEVQISVPVENAPRLKMGMPVELLDAQDKPLVKGNVAFISPNINPQSQSVLVKANFNNGTNQLKANQFVRARLIWASRAGVLVPTSAISRLGGQDFIFVAEPSPTGGKSLIANQKPVKLGKITGNKQEVLEGLNAKDQIVVAGILQLQNGAPIMPLYQFTKVWQHFCELKPKLCKGFKNTKWLRPFMFWYYLTLQRNKKSLALRGFFYFFGTITD